MPEEYEYFMVFELLDTGERERIEVEEDDLQSIFGPEQVYVIVKEETRRIFIWKGAKSPVRKRFISSRVASGLQEELVKEAAFHRCKIVSVDQGDEPVEFLKTFNLESMEVTEKMQDMRYVRNIEKDPSAAKGKVVDDLGQKADEAEEEYYSPALEELKRKGVDISANQVKKSTHSKSKQSSKPKYSKPKALSQSRTKSTKLTKAEKNDVIELIENTDIPNNYKRQNLIIGKDLYGSVSKVTTVFGDDIEETEWEKVKTLPEGIFVFENFIFRIYFDKSNSIIKGVEVLKPEKSGSPKPKMDKASIKLPNTNDSIDKKILEVELPDDYNRENLIIGYNLYGAISKTVEVFGEEQVETEWSLVKKFPKVMVPLESHMFRIYFNKKENSIDAIEILQKNGEEAKKISSTTKKSSPKKGRNLKKIPSSN